MAFDYKKEYKEFYLPKRVPSIVNVPPMNFIAVRGKGNPNEEDGEYKAAMSVLYGIAFTIKMSKMGDHRIEGYFDYVVPPLEGLWWQDGEVDANSSATSSTTNEPATAGAGNTSTSPAASTTGSTSTMTIAPAASAPATRPAQGINYSRKDAFRWISLIRLPEFVTKTDFDWAVAEATRKKKADFSSAEFLAYHEGLCVQCMHVGPYDDEPATVALMNEFLAANGYETDITAKRLHHEIYLSDARRTAPEKLKTVIRLPIRPVGKNA